MIQTENSKIGSTKILVGGSIDNPINARVEMSKEDNVKMDLNTIHIFMVKDNNKGIWRPAQDKHHKTNKYSSRQFLCPLFNVVDLHADHTGSRLQELHRHGGVPHKPVDQCIAYRNKDDGAGYPYHREKDSV